MRRRGEATAYGLLFLAAAVVAIAAVAQGPELLPTTEGLSPPQHAAELGRNRTAVLALLAGLLAVIGAIYTARNYRLSHRGQITERFFRAVELLDLSKPASVRLGSIYALESIARESPIDLNSVVNVLREFVDQHEEDGREYADIAAAAAVIRQLDPPMTEDLVLRRTMLKRTAEMMAVAASFLVILLVGNGVSSRVSDLAGLATMVVLIAVTSPWSVAATRRAGVFRDELRGFRPQPLIVRVSADDEDVTTTFAMPERPSGPPGTST